MVNKDNFIEALRYKDLKALDYLVDNYSDLGLKVSYSILNNRQLSEECTNDVLLKVWDNIASFNGSNESFGKWFVVITKKQAIDILRREKKHSCNLQLNEALAYIIEDNAFEEVNKKLEEEVLKSNLEALDENGREIIVRRYFNDESIEEISTNIGISKNAVSNRLLRVKKKLKKIFREDIL